MTMADAWVSLVSTGGVTRIHRGITRMHRGITIIHSGAARGRRRRIVNPIHAALVKGLGDTFIERSFV